MNILDDHTLKIAETIYKITAKTLGDHITRKYTPTQLTTTITNIMLGRTWRKAPNTAKK